MATLKDLLTGKVLVDRTNGQQYRVIDVYSAFVSGFTMPFMNIRYLNREYEETQEEDSVDEFGNYFRSDGTDRKVNWRDVKNVDSSLDDVCVE